jgi:hypothetical protein
MVVKGRTFVTVAALACMAGSLARAGDDPLDGPIATSAPLEIPHTLELLLGEKARKRTRRPRNIETVAILDLTPGLERVTWPNNSYIRARNLPPKLRRTPVVGWLAENLYRDKKDNGWCLEVDPGEGEYVVFYRYHPKR